MAKLKDKVQDALDESRIMVLGVQVLIGFDYRAAFESGFARLPLPAQLLKLGSLSLLLVTFALLIVPSADHPLGERGEDSSGFHRLATTFAALGLFPFAIALGVDVAIACSRLAGPVGAAIAGAVMSGLALAMWYGLELAWRPDKARREAMKAADDQKNGEKTDVRNKIRHALTEARVVLPGAQALLGFQFATTLLEGFDKLPQALKWLHFASLGCIAITIILLITPAAWHRIVERGEENERMRRLASAMIVAALVPLALGLAGDFFVVVYKVTSSPAMAAALSGAALLLFAALWFGLPLARRLAPTSGTRASRATPARA